MKRSLRTRLILGVIVSMTLLLSTSGVVIDLWLRRAMLAEIDQSLTATAQIIIPQIEYDHGKIDLDLGRVPLSERTKAQNLVELSSADGRLIARSALLEGQDLPRLAGSVEHPLVTAFKLADGQPARAVGVAFTLDPDRLDHEQFPPQHLVLVVARQTSELQHQLAHIRYVLVGSLVSVVLLVCVVGSVTIAAGLRPLNHLARQIEHIDPNDLKTRVHAAVLPGELVPIADRLNDLLARLDQAFELERGFTADVAHELRTPLAGLRSIADVTLSRRRPPLEYAEAMGQTRDIVSSMQAMVDQLLMLARMDAGQVKLTLEPILLRSTVDDVWASQADLANPRGLHYEDSIAAEAQCLADPGLLNIVLTNVLANAAEYTDLQGRVSVTSRLTGGFVQIQVSTTGCRLKPDDLGQLFRRFWRGDASRSATGRHSGLGLSLAQRAVQMMGGDIHATLQPESVLNLAIRLPANASLRS